MGLYAYGTANNRDRCAHAYHSNHGDIAYYNTSTPVAKCAVLKPNSDGSGANVGNLVATCTGGTTTAWQYPWGLAGHATGINQGANFHNGFFGYLEYY